jgi:hypothetical protein
MKFSNFIYIASFLLILVMGAAALYLLAQNNGLDFFNREQRQEEKVEESNILDDPMASSYGSCTHEKIPYISVSKGEEQKDFPAKVVYANNQAFTQPKQVEIPADVASTQVMIPEAQSSSQQIYYKLVYTIDGNEVSDDVQTLRLDPCNVEYKNI